MNNQLLLQGEASKYNSNSAVTRKMFTAVIFERFFLVQTTLQKTLQSLPYIQSVVATNHPLKADKMLQEISPDILILGTSASLKESLHFAKLMKKHCPQAGTIIITGDITPEVSRLLIKNGIQGILDESATEQDFSHAVQACITGNVFHSRAVYDCLIESPSKVDSLTMGEMQVLALILEGDNNHSISNSLYVTTKTVESHITRIYKKLDVSSRAQAILRAQELCLF
jgi:DNA-binding NarL/FixJ family response regulator